MSNTPTHQNPQLWNELLGESSINVLLNRRLILISVKRGRARSPGVPDRDLGVQPLDGLRVRARKLAVQTALHHDVLHTSLKVRSGDGGVTILQATLYLPGIRS